MFSSSFTMSEEKQEKHGQGTLYKHDAPAPDGSLHSGAPCRPLRSHIWNLRSDLQIQVRGRGEKINPGERAFYYPGDKALYGTRCGHGEEAERDFNAYRTTKTVSNQQPNGIGGQSCQSTKQSLSEIWAVIPKFARCRQGRAWRI